MNIKKGDKVKVIYGSNKGKEGTVEKILGSSGLAFVSGVNLAKKHIKSQGVVELLKPLQLSKLVVKCPKCQADTKPVSKEDNGKKIRICNKCEAPL